MKPQDGTLLPDDTLLDDVVLTGRARNVCKYPEPEIKTVGEIRRMSDFDLLTRHNCGKMTMLELRLLTGQYQPGKSSKSAEVLKAAWVRAVATGQTEYSFEDWRKEKEKTNAAGQ